MTCTLFKLIFIDLRREHTLFTDFSLIIFLTPFFSIVSDLAFPFPLHRRRVETRKTKTSLCNSITPPSSIVSDLAEPYSLFSICSRRRLSASDRSSFLDLWLVFSNSVPTSRSVFTLIWTLLFIVLGIFEC
ncbi:hypothetical protein QL285_011250 [Trifolium repens]|nr:hypothetical protein QL285_011250 [Trifolium repens]